MTSSRIWIFLPFELPESPIGLLCNLGKILKQSFVSLHGESTTADSKRKGGKHTSKASTTKERGRGAECPVTTRISSSAPLVPMALDVAVVFSRAFFIVLLKNVCLTFRFFVMKPKQMIFSFSVYLQQQRVLDISFFCYSPLSVRFYQIGNIDPSYVFKKSRQSDLDLQKIFNSFSANEELCLRWVNLNTVWSRCTYFSLSKKKVRGRNHLSASFHCKNTLWPLSEATHRHYATCQKRVLMKIRDYEENWNVIHDKLKKVREREHIFRHMGVPTNGMQAHDRDFAKLLQISVYVIFVSFSELDISLCLKRRNLGKYALTIFHKAPIAENIAWNLVGRESFEKDPRVVTSRSFFWKTNKTRMRSSAIHWSTAARSCKASNLWPPSISSAFHRLLRTRLAGGLLSAAPRDLHFPQISLWTVTEIKPCMYSFPFSWRGDFEASTCVGLTSRKRCCTCSICDSVS